MKKFFSKGFQPGITGALLFFLFLAVQFGSCVDVDNTFGTEYIPDDQIMQLTRDSSFVIHTYNVTTTDSVTSGYMIYNFFGGMHDQETGAATNAGVVFQINPASFSSDSLFGVTPVVDSAFFYLGIYDILGKSDVEQTFDVYELTELLSLDSTYYANFDPEPIISSEPVFSFTHSGRQSLFTYDLMGNNLIDRLLDTTDYTVDSLFRKRFKGFYLKPRDRFKDAALYLADLSSSGFEIFYHNSNPEPDTTSAFYMVRPYDGFTNTYSLNVTVSVVAHDFSEVKPELRLDDFTVPVSRTYMQGFGGIKTYMEFTQESVQALKDKVKAAGFTDLAINKAKLQVFYPERDPDKMSRLYSRLGMYFDYNTLWYIPDFNYVYEANYDTTLPYGGFLNRSRFFYEMDITSYVQRLFREGYERDKVYLGPAAGLSDYNHMQDLASFALDGTGSESPPELVITYTMIR